MDSIQIMNLVEILSRKGIEVTFLDLAERQTLKDWWKLISYKI